jgi:hypothetical protein
MIRFSPNTHAAALAPLLPNPLPTGIPLLTRILRPHPVGNLSTSEFATTPAVFLFESHETELESTPVTSTSILFCEVTSISTVSRKVSCARFASLGASFHHLISSRMPNSFNIHLGLLSITPIQNEPEQRGPKNLERFLLSDSVSGLSRGGSCSHNEGE